MSTPETENKFSRQLNSQAQSIKAAKLYHEEGWSVAEVARRLGISLRKTYRLIRTARENGLVLVNKEIPWHGLRELKRDLITEQKLRQVYELNAGVTIYCSDQLSSAEPLSQNETTLHALLAFSAASYLRDILRSGDSIGVGGGRTMGYLAKALHEREPFHKGIKIISMAGGPPRLHKTYGVENAFSADYNTAQVASTFPDAMAEFAFFGPYMKPSTLPKLPTNQPNIAIFGAGNVYHNIYHFTTDSEDPLTEPLRTRKLDLSSEIKLRVGEITSVVKQSGIEEANFYHPIGEVLGRLFVISPPVELHPFVPKEVFENLLATVRAINKRAFAIPEKTFKSAPIRILVAGGQHKLFSIHHLLENGFANSLITDQMTANQLITLKTT